MTPDEHDAFRSIVRDELAASEQRITAATAANLTDLRNALRDQMAISGRSRRFRFNSRSGS